MKSGREFIRHIPVKWRVALALPIWVLCVYNLLSWWTKPERISHPALFIPLSIALIYEFIFLPSIFLYFVTRAKTPPKRIAKKDLKVAVISLCVPNKESVNVIEKQLKAMSEIKYPHDSWILDEGNSKDVKRLAKKYKIKYFSRKGIRKYNSPLPPFKKKTKAGNVNAWLDHVKRRKYEFFVQLDIDHLPQPDYLNQTLGYFRDEKVGWVQAPSVYKNKDSWIARGSAEQELVLQGPLQMGFYGHSETPFIIGSHCTYRTKYINEIGGFQPTRAEDHLDTVVLASRGYKGVFLPKIIAEGDGPETLRTYLAQQFAWAYSMFQVLIGYSPRLLIKMPIRKLLQFLFAQTWYPFWSLSYFALFFTPIAALLVRQNVANVNAGGFVTHFLPVFAGSFLVWWAGRPLMQPKRLRLSWRGVILHAIRWPVILQAILYAMFRVKRPYMITPKGRYAKMKPSTKVYGPFLALGSMSSLAILFSNHFYGKYASENQIIFAMINSIFMAVICVVDIDLNLRKLEDGLLRLSRYWLKPIAAVSVLIIIIAFSIATSTISDRVSALVGHIHNTGEPVEISSMSRRQLLEGMSRLNMELSKPASDIGVYNDPNLKRPAYINSSHIVHVFADWRESRYLTEQLYINAHTDNTILITLEPRGDKNGERLLKDIGSGKYDKRLEPILEAVKAYKRPVYIRFAHEAELENLYPWSNQDPRLYISAFRHAVNYAHSRNVKNIKWVWAPAGNTGAEDYYPGDKYVDVVGTTILHDRFWYGASRPDFYQLTKQRLWLFKFDKPVWVVEFGAGHYDPAFQSRLIEDALKSYKKLGFSSLIYLNMVDANINGPDYRLNNPSILNIKSKSYAVKRNKKKKITPDLSQCRVRDRYLLSEQPRSKNILDIICDINY